MLTRFENWASELSSLPFWAEEWQSDHPELFQRYFAGLLQRNRELRDDLRNRIDVAIEGVRRNCASSLVFFRYDKEISLWSSRNCPLKELTSALELLSDLQRALTEFSETLLGYERDPALNFQILSSRYAESQQIWTVTQGNLERLSTWLLDDRLIPQAGLQSEDCASSSGLAAQPTTEAGPGPDPAAKAAPQAADAETVLAAEALLEPPPVEPEPAADVVPESLPIEAEPAAEAAPQAADTETVPTAEVVPEPESTAPESADIYPELEAEAATHKFAASSFDLPSFEFEVPPPQLELSDEPNVTPTLQDAERALFETISEQSWHRRVWELLANGDIMGARWLAFALETCGLASPVPSNLLTVLQGAMCASGDQPVLLASIGRYFTMGDSDDAVKTLTLAACLPLVLISPDLANQTGAPLRNWLLAPSCVSALEPIAETVEAFASQNWSYDRALIASLAEDHVRHAAREASLATVARWIEDEAPHRVTRYPAATDAWVQLVTRTGPIRQLAMEIIADQQENASALKNRVLQWTNRDFVSAQVNDRYQAGADRKRLPIVGDVMTKIEKLCKEFTTPAIAWCDLAMPRSEPADSWQLNAVGDYRDSLARDLPSAEGALAVRTGDELPMAAAIVYLRASLRRLRALLLLDDNDAAVPAVAAADQTIDALVLKRLWCLPELNFADDGSLAEATVELARAAYLLYEPTTAHRNEAQSIAVWCERQDYRFQREILRLIPAPARVEAEAFFEASRERAVKDLVSFKENTSRLVQSALINGILDDREGLDAQHRLAVLQPSDSPNVGAARAELRQIREDCALKTVERCGAIKARWIAVRTTLSCLAGITPETVLAIDQLMISMLVKANFRAAEQLLDSVDTAAVRGDKGLDRYLNDLTNISSESDKDVLQEFLSREPRIIEWLEEISALTSVSEDDSLPKRIEHARVSLAGCLGPIADRQRRRQTAEAVSDWLKLFELSYCSHKNRDEAAELVGRILRQVGFLLMGEGESTVQISKPESHWMLLSAKLSDGGQSPVPLYGSMAREFARSKEKTKESPREGPYRVLLLWGGPSLQEMESLFNELREKERPLIVLHLGILKPEVRCQVADFARRTDAPFLVLSFQLFIYLTHQGPGALRSFFRCTLPFSAINPYIRESGIVWQEMFFGRDEMLKRILNRDGTSVIYGGRQLGKSALQKHLERSYHQATPEQYVFLFDMRVVFAPQQGLGLSNLLLVLSNTLIAAGLIPKNRSALSNPGSIREAILQLMRDVPERRILILLDEADYFLEASALESPEFFTVNEFLNLMDATDYRFKVVFAGNYNTQRFSHIPNQRLTRSGEPVVVGPLETTAAIDLIRKPAEELGFRFESLDVVLKILSYTSCHANLLQYYMHELLRDLYSHIGHKMPPYIITARNVDEIYSRLDVQETMQSRIALTLKLDKEYRLVCFIAALHDDGGTPDSPFTRFYKLTELLTLAREYWSAGFASVTVDLMRSKLDEMCGLGLLIRNQSGLYRISSASLMRLFGTIDEIREKVYEIALSEPNANTTDDELHAWVGDRPGRYTPLTYTQERLLSRDRYSLRVILTSNALGREELIAMLPRLLPSVVLPPLQTGCQAVPPEIKGGIEWTNYLKNFWAEAAETGVYVLYQQPEPQTADELYSSCHAIQQHLKTVSKNQKRSLRVVLLLDPAAAWAWHSMPPEIRRALEEEVQDLIVPRRWDLAAIRRRLSETNRNYSDSFCENILKETGGWPLLLDKLLLDRWPSSEECVTNACARLAADLAHGGALAAPFNCAIGINPDSVPGLLYSYCVSQSEPVLLDLLPLDESLKIKATELEDAIEILKQFGLAWEFTDSRGDRTLTVEPVAAAVWQREMDCRAAAAT